MTRLAAPTAPLRRRPRTSAPAVRMRDRVPAQSLIELVLQARAEERPRSPLERLTGVEPVAPEVRAGIAAVAAQRAVADRLAALPSGWHVFHSVPTGRSGGDLDHLVVGPGGVFAVTSRAQGDGARRRAARAVRVDRAAAAVLADPPPVVPVTVGGRGGVRAEDLRRALLGAAVRLHPAEVAALADAFDDARTWQPAAEAGPELLLRFAALVREQRGAKRVRVAWTSGLAALAASGLALALPDVLHAFH